MTKEPEYNAHYRCWWCNALRPKTETIFCDDRPICRDGDCKEQYYETTKPRLKK